MTEQSIPYRIEAFADLTGLAYLRECKGQLCRGSSKKSPSIIALGGENQPVVIAEELDGENNVVRTWFVMRTDHRDGVGLTAACPTSRIVSRNIHPGEPTPDYDPNNEPVVTQWISESELKQIQCARDEMLADRERHLIHAKTFTDAVQRAVVAQSEVERLHEEMIAKGIAHADELKKRDDRIWELDNLAELNRQQIATLQRSYSALENRQTLRERIKVWYRSKLKRLRECVSKRAA